MIHVYSLQQLWLPSYRRELVALAEVERLREAAKARYERRWRASDHASSEALWEAKFVIQRALNDTVDHIVKRGGVLMIINPPAKGKTKERT